MVALAADVVEVSVHTRLEECGELPPQSQHALRGLPGATCQGLPLRPMLPSATYLQRQLICWKRAPWRSDIFAA